MKFTEFNSGRKTNLLAYKNIVSFFLFVTCIVVSSASVHGQNVIHESELHNNTNNLFGNNINVEEISSLLYDNNPAAYFQDGQSNYYGDVSPSVLFVDIDQFQNISRQINKLARIELVKIYMKGRSPRSINQEVLNELPSLKYVFFVCDRCGKSEMTNLFSSREDVEKGILIIYNSETNE